MSLNVSESFYSLQCEGASNGVPAYFVRLKDCNLICGGSQGCLVRKGRATWYCDSEPVWRQGTPTTNEQLELKMKQEGQLENILTGDTHLVWTGGEPTLLQNLESITDFLKYMNGRYGSAGFLGNHIYNEIETNGTLTVYPNFYDGCMQQINCSPKLSNSGMPERLRINPAAIHQILRHKNSWFKFVVSNGDDIKEAIDSYVLPLSIPKNRIILMPGLTSQDEYFERTKFIYEAAKKYNVRAVSRGHIAAWNRVTGV